MSSMNYFVIIGTRDNPMYEVEFGQAAKVFLFFSF